MVEPAAADKGGIEMPRQSLWPAFRASWLALLSLALLTTIVTAEDAAKPAESPAVAAEPVPADAVNPQVDADQKAAPPAHVDPAKSRKVSAGLAAVAGIAVFGVGSIAIVMLWARRLRRLARDLGPRQKTLANDFWFLKPPKPNVSSSDVGEHRPPPQGSTSAEITE